MKPFGPRARERRLPVKLVAVEFTLDESLVTISYSADERIELGPLIAELREVTMDVDAPTSTDELSELARDHPGFARAMVARYGMDEDLGHVSYDTDRRGFLGAGDQSSWLNRRYSDATAERMDAKVRDIVDGVFKRTLTLLETNLDLLEQSAQDLLQRETLDEPDLVAIGSKVKERKRSLRDTVTGV